MSKEIKEGFKQAKPGILIILLSMILYEIQTVVFPDSSVTFVDIAILMGVIILVLKTNSDE